MSVPDNEKTQQQCVTEMCAVKPITPEEALKKATLPNPVIPAEMIATVNELLAQRYMGRLCEIQQDLIVDKFLEKVPDVARQQIYDNHWLDFEYVFKTAGWKVTYDKPGYGDNYNAFFTFEKANKIES